MSYLTNKFLATLLILISINSVCYGQTRQEKTIAIIDTLHLIKNLKANYEFMIEPLKYQASYKDSIRILGIEKQLSENAIVNKISSAFSEVFSNEEVDDLYIFIRTSAFQKFFNSTEADKIIYSKFKDIDAEIKEITKIYSEPIEKPAKKINVIPVDKENGFYATVDYTYSTADKDVKLEDMPSLSFQDIQEVKKTYNRDRNRPEISIVFTKDGARKFFLLTKENIGKPIAIVIAKKIVSMPRVNEEIMGGKASISGDFTEDEIDKMIETLKEK